MQRDLRLAVLPDHRLRRVRSENCPCNGIADAEPTIDAQIKKGHGLCGQCSWGFYSMENTGHQPGEALDGLELVPIMVGGKQAGYSSDCGEVRLFRDKTGRIGALKTLLGKERFFPGIRGNFAYEKYLREHPEVAVA